MEEPGPGTRKERSRRLPDGILSTLLLLALLLAAELLGWHLPRPPCWLRCGAPSAIGSSESPQAGRASSLTPR